MCYQESLSLGWLAGIAVKVLSVREYLEQLTASLLSEKHMLLGVFCPVHSVAGEWLPWFWRWWSGAPRERGVVKGQSTRADSQKWWD